MMPQSSSDRALAGRKGAYVSWANTEDRAERTRPAREARLAKFEDQVDPDRRLTPEERARRAEFALKAYMTDLAIRSARSRRRAARYAALDAAEAAETELAELGDAS